MLSPDNYALLRVSRANIVTSAVPTTAIIKLNFVHCFQRDKLGKALLKPSTSCKASKLKYMFHSIKSDEAL